MELRIILLICMLRFKVYLTFAVKSTYQLHINVICEIPIYFKSYRLNLSVSKKSKQSRISGH